MCNVPTSHPPASHAFFQRKQKPHVRIKKYIVVLLIYGIVGFLVVVVVVHPTKTTKKAIIHQSYDIF
jgi:hypothetical protein